jgi:serine/threonine-protein kinase
MSPETIEHPNSVDARTDLYSLGAVAYYLVTGNPPFCGLSISEIMTQQLKTEPPKPSASLPEPLSADFEALLLHCLAKKPADRPANARQLEDALRNCANANVWGREEAEEWWRIRDAMQSAKTMVMPQPASTEVPEAAIALAVPA